MQLANAMEPAVQAHLNRVREEFAGVDAICWCPLCRADMAALSLSTLTPCYYTRRAKDPAADPERNAAVREKVVHAVRHVELHPKHAPGDAVPEGEEALVVSILLEEGFAAVEELLDAGHGPCECRTCRCDAVAFALNRYPARYGVRFRGGMNLTRGDRAQLRGELAPFLGLGLKVVATAPRH